MEKNTNKFMMRAIELSIESVKINGGPFGSVIVKNDKIIAEGNNNVTTLNDPTAHGEIVAIRNAENNCKSLNGPAADSPENKSSNQCCNICIQDGDKGALVPRIDSRFNGSTGI